MKRDGNEPAIDARDVWFAYEEGTRALAGVDFRAGQGEFVAMLASNGGGKTTLLRVLAKLLTPQRGRVEVNGRPLEDMGSEELYRQLGLVFQNPRDQLFAPTVEEDVGFAPRNADLSESEIEDRVSEELEAVGASHLRKRAVHHLSFGEKKRVSLAGVLAMRPSILVLDEPTAGLDPAGEADMLHLLNRLNSDRGITVVMATHSVDLLPLFADRLYVLKDGAVLREGTPEDVFADEDAVEGAQLRLPHISRLARELRDYDGVPLDGLPLTVRETRLNLLEFIPAEKLVERLKGDQ
ncbi:MAG: ATP-binding cassette domain-containing protein [Planctomycetota bacterium]